MKTNVKKFVVVMVLLTTGFLFNNSVQVTNNPQQIRSYVFGPSPISEDGRNVFDSILSSQSITEIKHNEFWRNLRTKMDSIFIHALFLDHLGLYQSNGTQLISLNQNQVEGLIKIQQTYDYKVILDLGLSLGSDCRDLPAWQIAENAANEDMSQLSRFFYNSDGTGRSQKLRVDAINIDGPFLRVIRGSRKAYSCNTSFVNGSMIVNDRGYSQTKSIEIVGRYLSRLQRKINEAQGSNPKMNIVINLPNWNAGGYEGNFNLDLIPLIEKFASTEFYPSISEVSIDYPYGYVVADRPAFFAKINALYNIQSKIRGNPKFSIIVNQQTSLAAANALARNTASEGDNVVNYQLGYECMMAGRRMPLLLTYYNRCLSEELGSIQLPNKAKAQSLIQFGNQNYVRSTIGYHKLVLQELPSGVVLTLFILSHGMIFQVILKNLVQKW
jgi:hypothetical protein